MPSNFPGSLDAYTTKVDKLDANAAADVNALQDAVAAIETTLKTSPNPNPLDYVSKTRPDIITGVKSGAWQDWGGERYNVKSASNPRGGAKGDGVTDDTLSFTGTSPNGLIATLKGTGGTPANSLNGATGVLPPGAYVITARLDFLNLSGIRLEAAGRAGSTAAVQLVWNGTAGSTFMLLDRVRDSYFGGFMLKKGSSAFGIGIDWDSSNISAGNVFCTNVEFEDIEIQEPSVAGLRFGHSQQGNVDQGILRRVAVNGKTAGTTPDGLLLESGQSKKHDLYDTVFAYCVNGIHVSNTAGATGGSFHGYGLIFETNTVDVLLDRATDTCGINGFYSENSQRFIYSSAGANSSSQFTCTFQDGVWNSSAGQLNADGFVVYTQQRGPYIFIGVDFMPTGTHSSAAKFVNQNSAGSGASMVFIGCKMPNNAPFPSAYTMNLTVLGCMCYDNSDAVVPLQAIIGGTASSTLPLPIQLGLNGLAFQVDSNGHLITTGTTAPVTSALNANVSSATPTGNDTRGKIVIVATGAVAANTRICSVSWFKDFGVAPALLMLVNQTSGAGLAIVNFYAANAAGNFFDLMADQALAAGTYTVTYFVMA